MPTWRTKKKPESTSTFYATIDDYAQKTSQSEATGSYDDDDELIDPIYDEPPAPQQDSILTGDQPADTHSEEPRIRRNPFDTNPPISHSTFSPPPGLKSSLPQNVTSSSAGGADEYATTYPDVESHPNTDIVVGANPRYRESMPGVYHESGVQTIGDGFYNQPLDAYEENIYETIELPKNRRRVRSGGTSALSSFCEYSSDEFSSSAASSTMSSQSSGVATQGVRTITLKSLRALWQSFDSRPTRKSSLVDTDRNENEMVNYSTVSSTNSTGTGGGIRWNSEKHPQPKIPDCPPGTSTEEITRRHVVEEIVEQENSYFKALRCITEDYMEPLKACDPPIMSDDQIDSVFINIPEIYRCHMSIQISLEETAKLWWENGRKIGEVVRSSFSRAVMEQEYLSYVGQYLTSITLLKKYQDKIPALQKFLHDRQKSIGDKLPLESHILKPIQRYPQLRLQVLALVKRTPRSHADIKHLQEALGCLSSTTSRLDNHRRVAIDKQKARDVLKQLKRSKASKLVGAGGATPGTPSFGVDSAGPEGTGGREPLLVRWDEVCEVVYTSSGQQKKKTNRRLFLFSDQIICAKVPREAENDTFESKWTSPLVSVDHLETDQNSLQSEEGKGPIACGDILKASSQGTMSIAHSTALIQKEVDNLQKDRDLLQRILTSAGMLNGVYGGLSQSNMGHHIREVDSNLETRRKQLHTLEDRTIILSFDRAKQSAGLAPGSTSTVEKGQRPLLYFQFSSAQQKQNWLLDFRMVALADHPKNNPCWLPSSEGVDGPMREPVLMDRLPTLKGSKSVKVRCAVSLYTSNFPDGKPRQHLWLLGGGNKKGLVSVVALYPKRPQVKDPVQVCDSCITHAVLVPSSSRSNNSNETLASVSTLESSSVNGASTSTMNSASSSSSLMSSQSSASLVSSSVLSPSSGCEDEVWMVTEKREVRTHRVSDLSCPTRVFSLPSAATGMLSVGGYVYISTEDGHLLQYSPNKGNSCYESPAILKVSDGVPIVDMIRFIKRRLLLASSSHLCVVAVDGSSPRVMHSYLMTHRPAPLHRILLIGQCVWVAFQSHPSIHVYHTDDMDSNYRQEKNVVSLIKRELNDKSKADSISVQSLAFSSGTLWVGTNRGHVCTFPTPVVIGTPSLTGDVSVSVCVHAHSGPVDFILPMECHPVKIRETPAENRRRYSQFTFTGVDPDWPTAGPFSPRSDITPGPGSAGLEKPLSTSRFFLPNPKGPKAGKSAAANQPIREENEEEAGGRSAEADNVVYSNVLGHVGLLPGPANTQSSKPAQNPKPASNPPVAQPRQLDTTALQNHPLFGKKVGDVSTDSGHLVVSDIAAAVASRAAERGVQQKQQQLQQQQHQKQQHQHQKHNQDPDLRRNPPDVLPKPTARSSPMRAALECSGIYDLVPDGEDIEDSIDPNERCSSSGGGWSGDEYLDLAPMIRAPGVTDLTKTVWSETFNRPTDAIIRGNFNLNGSDETLMNSLEGSDVWVSGHGEEVTGSQEEGEAEDEWQIEDSDCNKAGKKLIISSGEGYVNLMSDSSEGPGNHLLIWQHHTE